jgi:CBS domain-containing protein
MQVKNIMTKNPACCTPDSTLQEVAHMMEMYDCGCIPVIQDHQTKRPIGTITDRDITIRALGENKNPLEMKASDIMTTEIVTVTPETSLEDCLNKMEDRQIRRVLVADKNGRCIGIVAQADVVEHGTPASRTADFIREVSESERQHDRGYESQRSQLNERRTFGQNNYSSSQNRPNELHNRESFAPPPLLKNKPYQLQNRSAETHYKPAKKESFFNSKMLLTLLGTIGLGAGLRYYLGPESENKQRPFTGRKIRTYNADAGNTLDTKSSDSSIHSPTTSVNTTTSSTSSSTQKTKDKDKSIGVSGDSFNKTNDDNDLKPITEVGRTATNT